MNRIEKMLQEMCPDGVEYRPLGELTIWDKRFSGVPNEQQMHTCRFKHVDAKTLKSIQTNDGNIKLLSTGNFDGFTNREISVNYINSGEVIAIPSGGTASIKYWNGLFVDSGNILAISSNEQFYNLKYVYYCLLNIQNAIQGYYRGSGIQHPDMAAILRIKLPVPPLEIQKEIVNVLDNFTEYSTELQTELQARIKQYGYYRDRLLSFDDLMSKDKQVEWRTLGELGTFKRGNGIQKKDFVVNGFPCIHYGQLYTYYGIYASRTKAFITEELAKNKTFAQKGDLVIATTSENDDDVCKAVAWVGDNDVAISGDAYVFHHKENPKYMSYFFQSTIFQEQKRRYITGTKVRRVSGDNMAKIKIPLPSLQTQGQIVKVLDTFDSACNSLKSGLPAEIAARQKQYEYYRDKLLTFKELKK